jgi:hypothetical protein
MIYANTTQLFRWTISILIGKERVSFKSHQAQQYGQLEDIMRDLYDFPFFFTPRSELLHPDDTPANLPLVFASTHRPYENSITLEMPSYR